jgi:hypothetical protein
MANPIQHLCQTQANITQHSVQTRPTTSDENFKQCQTQSNIFAKSKPILPCNTGSVSAQMRPTMFMMKILNDTKPNPTSLPNPSQYYHATHAVSVLKRGQRWMKVKQCQIQSNIYPCQTQANITQHSAQTRPTTLDENFKQCQTQANITYLFIYLALPTRAGSPQQHMPITVGPFT